MSRLAKNSMKMLLVCLLAATTLCGGCIIAGNDGCNKHCSKYLRYEHRGPVLRHVVLFSFKDGTTRADVKKIENAFAALPSKIWQIRDFEWGTDVSVENLAKGYTHCFFVTFRSEADRDAYLPHPEHKKFGKILGPHMEQVLVLDYWAK